MARTRFTGQAVIATSPKAVSLLAAGWVLSVTDNTYQITNGDIVYSVYAPIAYRLIKSDSVYLVKEKGGERLYAHVSLKGRETTIVENAFQHPIKIDPAMPNDETVICLLP